MAQLMVEFTSSPSGRAARALAAFKTRDNARELATEWFRLTLLQPERDRTPNLGYDAIAGRWLGWCGTWFHSDAPGGSAEELLRLLGTRPLEVVARELEGFFALVVIDGAARELHVVTDRCGSCHVFFHRRPGSVLVSSSSATLALAADASSTFDASGLRQFIATGNIYGETTLWSGVSKLPPATICTFADQSLRRTTYWSFADIEPERLTLDESTEAVGDALVRAARTVRSRFERIACDVTGGYDSRACLSGFVAAGVRVDATVSGDAASADVRVSKKIAATLGLRHIHTIYHNKPSLDDLLCAMRLTDGEYDAFDYARIRTTHRRLSEDHDVSINGSFGELARGYWWELLVPRLRRTGAIDARRIIAARFTAPAAPTDALRFMPKASLESELSTVASNAITGLAGLPVTTQLDCIYYTLRMQRWQGRIASSTDQIWPCLSPFAFPTVLVPILETKAWARIGSRMARALMQRLDPRLAAIELEHGYPAQPVSPANVVRFAPLFGHLLGRAYGKATRIVKARVGADKFHPTLAQPVAPQFVLDEQLEGWLSRPLLLDTGFFDPRALRELLARRRGLQWTRLATLELLLRGLAHARTAGDHSSADR